MVLAALATGCSHSANRNIGAHVSATTATGTPNVPGQLTVQAPGVDLSITDAVDRIGPSGAGTLTMTVHNGGDAPEHLDMVAAPDGVRGTLEGAGRAGSGGSMGSAGILIPQNATVVFGGQGPAIRIPAVPGVTAASRTLPLALEFGVARLVHLTVRVSAQ